MSEQIRVKALLLVEIRQADDGWYEVFDNGQVILRTKVRAAADTEFDEIVFLKSETSRNLRQKERAFFDMQATRSESFERRAAAARKAGGRGGRGGV
jgi:hypothetical protein